MKKYTTVLLLTFSIIELIPAQNVGIGTGTPQAMLHIKGIADTSQLLIDASAAQSNKRPLIRLRDATGSDIMHINTDGPFNTFIGLNAGRVNVANPDGSGLYNTFIGSGTGYYNVSGAANTAVGRNALYQNTGGGDNTAIGFKSLFSNTTGVGNCGLGSNALLFNQTGRYNTAIGIDALSANVSGVENVAMGGFALKKNTTGDGNTATGFTALEQNTTGGSNVANGARALFANTSGRGNVAVGYSSLQYNTTGYDNTGIGDKALYVNSTGFKNTGIGDRALSGNTVGTGNTAIGSEALYNNTTGSGNSAFGFASGPNSGHLSNTTCIGNGATAIGSNQIVLGNANVTQLYCYGAFIGTSAFAPNMVVLNTGQIVRSTSSARYKKDIAPMDINTANIYKLKPVSYNTYTDDSHHFGLLAEDVAAVIPELAVYSKEKDVVKGSTSDKMIPDAVQYPLLSVLMLKEVQKHEQTISEQQKLIDEMKKMLVSQQQQIEDLRRKIK